MPYQVGQLRFNGKDCVNTISTSLSYHNVLASSTGSDDSASFQDVLITPNSPFETNRDYYFHVIVPQDINYNTTFNIKLIKNDGSTSRAYQFLKQVTIIRGGTGDSVHNVALYEDNDGAIKAMIPLEYDGSVESQNNLLYLQTISKNDGGTSSQFYLGKNKTYVRTDKVNMVKVSETWHNDVTDNFGVFDIIFRPVEAGFNGILLEMIRTTEDYSIQNTITQPDGSVVVRRGRIVDLEKIRSGVKLYSLNNLVDKINKDGTLERIGVWSHPGLIMAINGEEIHVGPSGYYEEDVIPISSLGIVAADGDYSDNWSLDYTFSRG